MSLEEQIIEWSTSRPAWQRTVLRRVAMGEALSDKDYDALLVGCLSNEVGDASFGVEHLPQANAGDPPVTLLLIERLEHVNALSSDKPLAFEPIGLTIIYGDNASGKSGYARLLKRMARARHREEVLSDVFRDTAIAKPKAAITVKIGEKQASIAWPESTPPELQRILFYDGACGAAYVTTESDFLYRPSILFLMDGLIEACIALRNRIDIKLEENTKLARTLPAVNEDARDTEIGKYLSQLSGESSLDLLDTFIKRSKESTESIEELKEQEALLRTSDTSKQKQELSRQIDKFKSLRDHLGVLQDALGYQALASLHSEHNKFKALEEAANLVAQTFESEPLTGVGTSPWKELWESARRFSHTHAYPGLSFPVVGKDALCVLCQQPLNGASGERISRFEHFVQDDTQTRLRQARELWASRTDRLNRLSVVTEATEMNLKDLEAEYSGLVLEVRGLLSKYETVHRRMLRGISSNEDLPNLSLQHGETSSRLESASAKARVEAEELSDAEKIKQRLTAATTRRKELELLQEVANQRNLIIVEVTRLKRRELLEAAKNAAATGPITKKISELSESNITEVVRDTFTRETDRLRLERVTITKTRGEKGMLLHQPKLVGSRQNATLPLVFSEGERTALGLAAFFTEAQMDPSKSALVLDDPVSSLDHIRRALVAARLSALAETRQVVVFTHDISFVADLKREAGGLGVPVCERSVTRGFGGERKPGLCSGKHPWKAKDVAERLGELRDHLARIKKARDDWDEATYETEVASWAGNLSETWERMFSQELVGPVLAEGGLEVRPMMVKILVRFSETDGREFQASYSRVSQWAKRHDKSALVNYVAPEVGLLEEELKLVEQWFSRVKQYKA
jgi:hypothetical protein